MSNQDFKIVFGVLKKYTGTDKNVVIPDGVSVIGKYAFSGCTGLTSVKFGKGIKKIDQFAFSGCTGLKEVTIESGKIGKWAFHECTGLKTVKIGKGVKEICAFAFQGCKIDKAVIGSKNVGCLYAGINTLVLEKTVAKFDLMNFNYSVVAYCEAKKKPFGWKWPYAKEYYKTLMREVKQATIHWGADISKI